MRQRLFRYGQPLDYALESLGLLAAIGSGVALAMVNLVMGQFMGILTDFTVITTDPSGFMANVSKFA